MAGEGHAEWLRTFQVAKDVVKNDEVAPGPSHFLISVHAELPSVLTAYKHFIYQPEASWISMSKGTLMHRCVTPDIYIPLNVIYKQVHIWNTHARMHTHTP